MSERGVFAFDWHVLRIESQARTCERETPNRDCGAKAPTVETCRTSMEHACTNETMVRVVDCEEDREERSVLMVVMVGSTSSPHHHSLFACASKDD